MLNAASLGLSTCLLVIHLQHASHQLFPLYKQTLQQEVEDYEPNIRETNVYGESLDSLLKYVASPVATKPHYRSTQPGVEAIPAMAGEAEPEFKG